MQLQLLYFQLVVNRGFIVLFEFVNDIIECINLCIVVCDFLLEQYDLVVQFLYLWNVVTIFVGFVRTQPHNCRLQYRVLFFEPG